MTMLIELSLSQYKDRLKLRRLATHTEVLDTIRRKFVMLTPEEYVRQLMVHYLITSSGYSLHRIQIEREIIVNQRSLRFDIVVLDGGLKPHMVIECKSHNEQISDATFHQVSMYNQSLQAKYLVITNGIHSYCAYMDYEMKSYHLIDHIPSMSAT